MNYKRVTVISGHYGSGKSNIAINMTLELARSKPKVALADIDIVNPYFRSKDSEELLTKAGVRLICSPYANSNVDIPALPQDIYSITDDRSMHCILDVGGDERGALALGRIAPAIGDEDNFDMLLVVNFCRPLTRDAASALEVMREIEAACGLSFSGIINNSNLGAETTPELVIDSATKADRLSLLTQLPVIMTTAERSVAEKIGDKVANLYPINMQIKP